MDSDQGITVTLLKDYVPTGNPWSTTVEFPPLMLLGTIEAYYSGCDITCTTKIGEDEFILPLDKASVDVPSHNWYKDFIITVDTEIHEGADPLIAGIVLSFVPIYAIQIDIADIEFKQKPEQGWALLINFSEALEFALGLELCLKKQIEITTASEKWLVQDSSGNFLWKGHNLYCHLPVGIPMRLRMRYETARGWVNWSNWMDFSCKRKGSL